MKPEENSDSKLKTESQQAQFTEDAHECQRHWGQSPELTGSGPQRAWSALACKTHEHKVTQKAKLRRGIC